MKNLLLSVMFASTAAAAQEFSADMPAMGAILAQARIYKVKHAGRTPSHYVGRYEPRHIRFELSYDVTVDAHGPVYLNKSIRMIYRDSPLAVLTIYGMERGIIAAGKLIESMEDMRLRAVAQGQVIAVDYAAVARHNETGAWNTRRSNELELLHEIIRAEQPAIARISPPPDECSSVTVVKLKNPGQSSY